MVAIFFQQMTMFEETCSDINFINVSVSDLIMVLTN